MTEKSSTALAERAQVAELERTSPARHGVITTDKWNTLRQIAQTVADTEFVPRGLRGNPPAVMACVLYGDALGLPPMVSLREIHVIDGRPSMSANAMVGLVREAGHRIERRELFDAEKGELTGVTAVGVRRETGEADEFTFTLKMAQRAGLLGKDNWKKYPEAMLWARAVSQLCRMLFSDVFQGMSVYTDDESLEMREEERLRNGGARDAAGEAEAVDYGDEPQLAVWLETLMDDLAMLPAKRRRELDGLDHAGRLNLAASLEGRVRSLGRELPEHPGVEVEVEAVVEDDEGIAFGDEGQGTLA